MGRLEVRATAAALLVRSREACARKDFVSARALAEKAVSAAPQDPEAWRQAGVCRENLGDVGGALQAYEQALDLSPQDASLARDLARLASLMEMPQLAEQFLLHALRLAPGSIEVSNDLAVAWCAQARFAEAIELLRASLTANPEAALLWNTLGCVLFEQGQAGQSLVFFDEAIRLAPRMHTAHFNRANARKALGDAAGAVADCDRAISLGADNPSQDAMYRYARALALLTAGDVGAGWDAYAVRNDPDYPEHLHHQLPAAAWRPGDALRGRRLLVVGEQGLGDEVLFANVLQDAACAVGPEGRLLIAVDPRLSSLFQRSFPTAQVVAHETGRDGVRRVRHAPAVGPDDYDCWAPMGDLLAAYRRNTSDFPSDRRGYLKADPSRVAHWQAALSRLGPQPKIGLIWRSLVVDAQRQKFYPPLELWEAALQAPGLTFINLQPGDCAQELQAVTTRTGVEVITLPGLDLRDDLDDVAALSLALDVVIGPATATTNIAAAVGASTWFVTTPDAWPRLGTATFPWYPQARAFSGTQAYDWPAVMAEVAEALRVNFPTRV